MSVYLLCTHGGVDTEYESVGMLVSMSIHVYMRSCTYNNNNNRIERRNSRFFTISSLRREPSPTRTLK